MQLTGLKKWLGNKIFWLLGLLMAVSLIYLDQFTLAIKDPVINTASGLRARITLPYIENMPAAEYVISGKIHYHRFLSADTVHIRPDDELLFIRVNNHDIPLNDVDPAVLHNFGPGFDFNLGRYLREGSNDIALKIRNKEGDSGLFFENSGRDIKTLIADWLLMISLFGLVYIFLSGFIADKKVVFVLWGGFVVRVLYFLVTPYDVRHHDVWEHLHYIQYIVQNGALPPIRYNLETYQPPVYYVISALIYKMLNLMGIVNSYIITRWLQFCSLLLSMGFLFATWYIFRILFAKPAIFNWPGKRPAAPPSKDKSTGKMDWLLALTLALATFWPSNIIHSIRISNEIMFYCLFAWSLLFLVKWHFDDTDRSFFAVLIFTALCFVTKATGIVLYGLIGTVFLWKFFKEWDWKKYLPRAAVILAVFTASFLITFGGPIDERLHGRSDENFMVGGTNELGGLRVGNGLENFLWFDLPEFVSEPYISFEENGSRRWFWNYLFKSGLVGEFFFDTGFQGKLAVGFSILFLGMLLYTVFGLIMTSGKGFGDHIVLFFNLVFLLIAEVLIRVSLPYTCMNDFRYILPVLISFCFFFGYALAVFRQKGWKAFEIAGYTMALAFIASSVLFFVRLLF